MKPVVGVTPYRRDKTGERYVPEGYFKALEMCGCIARVIDYDVFPMSGIGSLVDELDAMLFTGGADIDPSRYGEEEWQESGTHNPNRDELEFALFEKFFPTNKPILGICRGHEVINVAMGGTIIQDIPKVFGTVHRQDLTEPPFWHMINITEGSRVNRTFGETRLMTNSYHHQSVKALGAGLVKSAEAMDGVIEAFECPGDRFLVGLQWHPEKTLGVDKYSIMPFNAFREAIG